VSEYWYFLFKLSDACSLKALGALPPNEQG